MITRRFLALFLMIPAVACQRLVTVEGGDGGNGDETTGDFPAPPRETSSSATSAAATEGSTMALDTSGDGDGNTFIDPDPTCVVADDQHWHCSPVDCDIYGQTGCAQGEKCTSWSNDGSSWDDTRCVPVADDPAAPGEACHMEGSLASGVDDCDAESMCWFVDDETLEGRCVPFCTGSESEPVCPDTLSCMDSNDGSIVLCLPVCDPLLGNCEQPDTQCSWSGDDFHCLMPGGGHQAGEPCQALNACASGLLCGAAEAVAPSCDLAAYGCCTPFCDLTAPDCFDPAQACVPWWSGGAPPGQENLGVCLLPE